MNLNRVPATNPGSLHHSRLLTTVLVVCMHACVTYAQEVPHLVDVSLQGSSYPSDLVFSDQRTLYFTAQKNSSQRILWSLDVGDNAANPIDLISDDTTAQMSNVTVFLKKIFFTVTESVFGAELWRTNGSIYGTTIVRDIDTTNSSNPQQFQEFNNKLYFSASNGQQGVELWRTNGTGIGTQLVYDINPQGSSEPQDFYVAGSTMYFSAYNNDGIELWKITTDDSVVRVKDINPGIANSLPKDFTFVPELGLVFFTADDGIHGRELWKTNGTEAGTVMVKDINDSTASKPKNLTSFDGKLYFSATTNRGEALMSTDGIADHTRIIEVGPDWVNSSPNNLFVYKNDSLSLLFFSAESENDEREIWVLQNGQEPGLFLDVTPNSGDSNPRNFMQDATGGLYFIANHNDSAENIFYICCIDDYVCCGRADSTFVLESVNHPGIISFDTMALYQSGNNVTLFYTGNSVTEGYELWYYRIQKTTSVAHLEEDDLFTISPNPNNGVFAIQSKHLPDKIEVFNIAGIRVYENNAIEKIIDLSILNEGVYFVNFSLHNKNQVVKLVLTE